MKAVEAFFPRGLVQNIRRAPLGRKLSILIIFTISVILIYCLMVFLITSHANSKREHEEYLKDSYYLKQELLRAYLSEIEYTAYSVIFSNWVQRFMIIDQVSSHAVFQEYQQNARHFLTNLASITGGLSFVLISRNAMVWSNNNLRYDLQYNIEQQPWFYEFVENKKYIEYGKSELFADIGDVWSMTLYYPVISYFNFSQLGYLAINVTSDRLIFLANGAGEKRVEKVTVYDSEGAVIVSNNQEMWSKPEAGRTGPGTMKFTSPLMDGQWTLEIEIGNTVNLFGSLGNMRLIYLLLIPIIFLFIMIIAAFSRYLTIPIIKCNNAMLAIGRGQFGLTIENHYKDEIGKLIRGFNDMSIDLAALIKQNEEINARRREAEIDILQQKVNPHFLYNTLEIINALILSGQNKNAINVCEMLGAMYHYNLTDRKWVTLRDECEYLKSYLALVRYRINTLSIFWDVNENALDTDILKLTIQPLVENAVRHGLSPDNLLKDGACLTVSISPMGNKTEISVMDNGTGIGPEKLKAIENTLESIRLGVPHNNIHVGIPNVYQRLYLEYGGDMDFTVESRLNYGSKFTIAIPAKCPDA